MRSGSQPGWVVMKFGGSSVSAADSWNTISGQARKHLDTGRHVLIVVSALTGVTDRLTALAEGVSDEEKASLMAEIRDQHADLYRQLGLESSRRFTEQLERLEGLLASCGRRLEPGDRAELLAQGELLSSSVGEQALGRHIERPAWQDARQLLQVRDDCQENRLSARCEYEPDRDLATRLAGEGRLHITQGFMALNRDGRTCLLGRGGSDTSAAYLAARLNAEALEIWTDVPGIFSADPRSIPEARLLRKLSYSEAQELASMGASVLHPPSIQPVRRHGIPTRIRDTGRPDEGGTQITARAGGQEAQVKGVVSRSDITLISMENPAMWHQAGFLADAFAVFKRHGISVDLISTSESTVTVSLDPQSNVSSDEARTAAFLDDLERLCQVRVQHGCVSISLVGNAIRTILGKLSAALEVFQDRHVHLVTQSANDLNLTLVVDPEHAASLVRKLHQLLIASQAGNRPDLGPSWSELSRSLPHEERAQPWWQTRAGDLLTLMGDRDAAYVYDLETARAAARRLLGLNSVARVLYAIKANDHPDLLNALAGEGTGFECVSMAEVRHVLASVEGAAPGDILFTPNFAPRAEYEQAVASGVRLTVDNAWAVQRWPELFAGQDLFLRLDLDTGYGHHKKVITSGPGSKFGISAEHLDEVCATLGAHGARVVGLHAHTGSGVHIPEVWREQVERFLHFLPRFPDVEVLDLGGGLGVPDRAGQAGFDLARLDELLAGALDGRDVSIWLEPGRYLAAESGVLLARVTQLKSKGPYRYLGLATGMNSLIRPALYGAYHHIVNLSRLDEPADTVYRVVGPICESGDVLGESRMLPASSEGDVVLVANAGAYGRVMSSSYNRREAAEEVVI